MQTRDSAKAKRKQMKLGRLQSNHMNLQQWQKDRFEKKMFKDIALFQDEIQSDIERVAISNPRYNSLDKKSSDPT